MNETAVSLYYDLLVEETELKTKQTSFLKVIT